MTSERKVGGWVDKVMAKASTVLHIGEQAADVLVHLQSPTPMGVAAVGFRVLDKIQDHRAISATAYYRDGWKPVDTFGMAQALYEAASAVEKPQRVPGTQAGAAALVHTLYGVELGWDFNVPGHRADGLWVHGDNKQGAREALGRAVWSTLGASRALLTTTTDADGDVIPEIIPEDPREILPSSLGREIVASAKKFNAHGYNRSEFLVGEPGCGKSCLMRYAAQEFGGFSLRIGLEDVAKLSARAIAGVVHLLLPDVLLIDDLDRYAEGNNEDCGYLLDALEEINRAVKLFIVSANYSEDITAAMLRPGRFDKKRLIKEVDPEIVQGMLDGLDGCPESILKTLRHLPIAYIEEFRKRVQVDGAETALSEVKELIERDANIYWEIKKQLRRKGRVHKGAAKLTDRQRAARYQGHAAQFEKKAASWQAKASKKRDQADKALERARKKSEKKAAESEKKKAKAKRSSKKASKKATTKKKEDS